MHPASPFRSTSTILLFLKAPRCGDVKTRLARHTDPERAVQIYRALAERQCTQLPENSRIEIHYTPHDAALEMHQWLGHRYEFYPQCEGALGLRLERSVAAAFARGAKSAVCIGGDCPMLDRAHFEQTAVALENGYDVVFGPSEDGGYYLIGLNAPQPRLFQGIPWSAHNTLSRSLSKATELGLRIKQLETLYDIDEITELQRAIDAGRLPPDLMHGFD